jgi:hypothetical protein
MSNPSGSRRRRAAYAETVHSQSTGDIPLAIQISGEPRQAVGHHDTSSDNNAGNEPRGDELPQRPYLRDRRDQTDYTAHGLPTIEWCASGSSNNVGQSRQVVWNDEPNNDHDHTNHRNDRGESPRSTRSQGQSLRHEPPIANFVRFEGQRKSSQGRKLFSPSGLQNSEKATTRYDGIEFPLLPVSGQHTPESLSQTALNFAEIESGDFVGCVKFLQQHSGLLGEYYHLYIQEAWQALWDREKHYAHQCLSRWFLLDEFRDMRPRDIDKHINQRRFSGKRFMDKVDSMYRTLKTLRDKILLEKQRAEKRDPGYHNNVASSWSLDKVQTFFQGADGLNVLRNVGDVCSLVAQMKKSLQG